MMEAEGGRADVTDGPIGSDRKRKMPARAAKSKNARVSSETKQPPKRIRANKAKGKGNEKGKGRQRKGKDEAAEAEASTTEKRSEKGKRKGKDKEQAKEGSEEEEAEIDYLVEERKAKGGGRGREYLVRWKDGAEDSWLPERLLKGTPALDEWKDGLEPDVDVVIGQEELERKAAVLADWILAAKRIVVHTGAGVSTSAGVPDFRGKEGLWVRGTKKNVDIKLPKIQPTLTHNALVELERMGKIHWIVSQNYDNLHVRSGFPAEKLSELHGNLFVEVCEKCGRRYHREFEVMDDNSEDHSTGRQCEEDGCKGVLKDTIIHFGEQFEDHILQMAMQKSREADLSICIGSKLTVTPACSMPFYSKKEALKKTQSTRSTKQNPSEQGSGVPKVVVCNLQGTPVDSKADLVINHYCDKVMELVMKHVRGRATALSLPSAEVSQSS